MDAGLAERWVLGLQCAVVIGSLMAIGTVHVPVLLVVAAVTLAIPVAIVAFRLQTANARLFVAPAVVLILLSAYSLLQAVPMPIAWLRTLSPGMADIWSRCLLPFGEPGPKMASLSADPGASLREALKWITYAAAFGSAAVLGARRGLGWAVTLIFGAAVLAAFTTIAHGLLGLHKVFGLYKPEYAHLRWGMGPLLNPNNLAGYLNLGALCGFGLMLSRESRLLFPRWAVGFGIAVLVGTNVIAASRAGTAALPAGLFVFWLLTHNNRRLQRSRTARRLWWASVAAVVGGLILAIFGATQQTWRDLFDRNLEKLQMIGWAWPLVRKFPWFGIGRGSSESVFAAFRQVPGHTVFTHIENFAAEWIAEWGVPVAVCALIALCWYLRPSKLKAREGVLAAAVLAAAVTLLGQNFFDLGLDVPGVCIGLATLLGAAYGAAQSPAEEAAPDKPRARSSEHRMPLSVSGTAAWMGLVAPLALMAWIGTARWGRQTDLIDRNEVHDAFATLKAGDESATTVFYSMLHQAMLRHPAEPYFPLMGGVVAWSANRDALPWLTRSLARDPMNGVTHFATACVVAARSRLLQALLELKFAGNDDADLVTLIGRISVGWTHDENQLKSILPDDGGDAAIMLTSMAQALGNPSDASLRMSLLRLATQRDPENVDARTVWAGDLVAALGPHARTALCQGMFRARCVAEVRDQIRKVAALDPGGANALNLTAELLLALGHTADAARLMGDQCPKLQEHGSCARVWLAVAARAHDLHSVSDAVDQLTSGCRNAIRCAAAYTYAGNVLMREGMPALALTSYQHAALDDSSAARWLKVADAASESGAHSVALDALQKVKEAGRDTPDIERRLAGERREVAATLVGAGGE